MDYKDKYIKYKTKYLQLHNNMVGGSNYITNYTIIKTLGKGMHGTVYLVKNNSGEEFAMKVEQIFEKDLEQNFKSPVWREIDFSNTMSSKYPQQFMKIFEYENKRCDYIHELYSYRWSSMNVNVKQYFEELFSSPFCSIKITSILDIMLHDIIYNISDKNIIYNLFIQVVYLSYLINKEGYYHRDLHPKNIGVIYTNDEFINILGKNIPTNGYILQAIDYGMVIHSKYDLDENEKKQLVDDNDLYQNVYKIIFKIMLKELIEKYPDKDINQLVLISHKDQKKIKKILNHIIQHNNYAYFEELLYKIIFFDKFQEQIGIVEKVKLFNFLSIKDVKYIFKNYNNLEKILLYLIRIY